MFRLLLWGALGVLGTKVVKDLMKNKDYQNKVEDIKTKMNELIKDISELSSKASEVKVEEFSNFLKQEIETELLNLEIDAKKDFLSRLEDLNKEKSGVKTLSKFLSLYISVLGETFKSKLNVEDIDVDLNTEQSKKAKTEKTKKKPKTETKRTPKKKL